MEPLSDPAIVEPLSVEDIDLTHRDARVSNAELNLLHFRLNDPEKFLKSWSEDLAISDAELDSLRRRLKDPETIADEQRRIEVRAATLFRKMMSASYTVLDQCYYYLYCHFQNNGKPSFHNAAYNIKTPVKQTLEHSEHGGRDSHCSDKRNKFVNEQCKDIFGSKSFDSTETPYLRNFQNNVLQLQAITKVNGDGTSLCACPKGNPCLLGEKCPDYAPKLVRAYEFNHPSENKTLKPGSFEPTDVSFKELESVENMDSWSETTIFNLLHFFRNFTTHRALVICPSKDGYLNVKTREFKPEGEKGVGSDWIKIGKGLWILVPEISDLKGCRASPRFHLHRLLIVCSKILSFVEYQRSLLLKMAGHHRPPIAVQRFLDGELKFERGNKEIGHCKWWDSYGCVRLWPVEN